MIYRTIFRTAVIGLLLSNYFTTSAQSEPFILKRIEELKEYSLKITELMPEEDTEGVIPVYNDSVATKLVSLLKEKDILNYNLDSLLYESAIQIHTSEDNKLKIFNWYTNNAGPIVAYYAITFAQTAAGPLIKSNSTAIPVKEIHTFQRKTGKVYMVKESGTTCESCLSNSFIAYTLGDSITEINDFFDGGKSSLHLEGWVENMVEFTYRPGNKEISLIYYVDEKSRKGVEKNGDKIELLYKFNGHQFVKVEK